MLTRVNNTFCLLSISETFQSHLEFLVREKYKLNLNADKLIAQKPQFQLSEFFKGMSNFRQLTLVTISNLLTGGYL